MINYENQLAFQTLVAELKLLNGLKCAHINVNGLVSKLDEIKLLLQETKIDILAITETHLCETITTEEIAIDGHLSARNDRKGQGNHLGGTIIYYDQELKMYEIDIDSTNIEAVWMELAINSQKLLLACIYRPPNENSFLQHF